MRVCAGAPVLWRDCVVLGRGCAAHHQEQTHKFLQFATHKRNEQLQESDAVFAENAEVQ